ncbi:MAG: hypothetical protein RMJ83_10195 [Armatimonadota bacterium]|nr:hypothetical protein [Armatimonadota bacterium]
MTRFVGEMPMLRARSASRRHPADDITAFALAIGIIASRPDAAGKPVCICRAP